MLGKRCGTLQVSPWLASFCIEGSGSGERLFLGQLGGNILFVRKNKSYISPEMMMLYHKPLHTSLNFS